MKKKLLLGIWVGLLLMSAGCAGIGQNGSGVVLMIPYTNEAMGIGANVPLNWSEVAPAVFGHSDSPNGLMVLQLQTIPGMALEDVKTLAVTELGLKRFPESHGRFSSAEFEWELFVVEFEEPTTGYLKALLALAADDNDSYAVLVGTYEKDYEAKKLALEHVFEHTLYSFMLLE